MSSLVVPVRRSSIGALTPMTGRLQDGTGSPALRVTRTGYPAPST